MTTLSSLDDIKQSGKFGAIYQFLMLGDNISHNHRISGNKFCIFDFDESIFLGNSSETSKEGIFNDVVNGSGHAYNNHFLDVLDIKSGNDKYSYIKFDSALINRSSENSDKIAYLEGTLDGLKLIKDKIEEKFILSWGDELRGDQEINNYLDNVRVIYLERIKNIQKNISQLEKYLSQNANKEIQKSKDIKACLSFEVSKIINNENNIIEKTKKLDFTVNNIDSGRLYDFKSEIEQGVISIDTPLPLLSLAIARMTANKIDNENNIHSSMSCNGPVHGLFVAKFAEKVCDLMLDKKETKDLIDTKISSLHEDAQKFLKDNGYSNYKKILQILSLLHDTGRPSDGLDTWEESNKINMKVNIRHFLNKSELSQAGFNSIIDVIEKDIEVKEGNGKFSKNDNILFSYPLQAGDALHSGHAFHGGKWDQRVFNANYLPIYNDLSDDFKKSFQAIIKQAREIIPEPNNNKLDSVKEFLISSERDDDGSSIVKSNYHELIINKFNNFDANVNGEYRSKDNKKHPSETHNQDIKNKLSTIQNFINGKLNDKGFKVHGLGGGSTITIDGQDHKVPRGIKNIWNILQDKELQNNPSEQLKQIKAQADDRKGVRGATSVTFLFGSYRDDATKKNYADIGNMC